MSRQRFSVASSRKFSKSSSKPPSRLKNKVSPLNDLIPKRLTLSPKSLSLKSLMTTKFYLSRKTNSRFKLRKLMKLKMRMLKLSLKLKYPYKKVFKQLRPQK